MQSENETKRHNNFLPRPCIAFYASNRICQLVSNLNLFSYLVGVNCHSYQATTYVQARDQSTSSSKRQSNEQLVRFSSISENLSRYFERYVKSKRILPESSCARVEQAFPLAKATHVVTTPGACPCTNCILNTHFEI